MLDIQFVRDNAKLVKTVSKNKNIKVDVDKVIELDEKVRKLQGQVDELRQQRNQQSSGGKKPSDTDLKKAQELKSQLDKSEAELGKLSQSLRIEHQAIPNLMADDTPLGSEDQNKVEKEVPAPKLDFKPKDHQSLGEAQGWIDFERGAKVAGNKFYYLKGPLVKLELALLRWGMDLLEETKFELITTPHMVRGRIAEGTGFAPRGSEDQEYRIEGEDLTLIATAEVPLTGYHADENLENDELPRLMAGFSPSYRKEAGAYGKHSKGLYRVHQFDKLEMYVVCLPGESESWQQKLLELEEKICTQLEIPYRVVRIASAELGAPVYKKYDIEYWSPVDQSYRELTSCSNCTDYQARNLNIRYRGEDGKMMFAHTINGTAIAVSRTLIAILENHQQADGTVILPKVLHKYYGKGGL